MDNMAAPINFGVIRSSSEKVAYKRWYTMYVFALFVCFFINPTPVPLFTKRLDVLPQDLVKSRSREIRV